MTADELVAKYAQSPEAERFMRFGFKYGREAGLEEAAQLAPHLVAAVACYFNFISEPPNVKQSCQAYLADMIRGKPVKGRQ